MSVLRSLADPLSANSLSHRFRVSRFKLINDVVARMGAPVPTILDLGGYENFWATSDLLDRAKLTILNLEEGTQPTHPSVSTITGDARDLSRFETASFDLVFSNSVIEHVGSWEDQSRMAAEVRRVGRSYFVQTPNFWFPFEPHVLLPGFQWLPVSARARLLERFSLGHLPRQRDPLAAFETVKSIRLLRESEVAALFPDAVLWRERFLGLTKSFVAYRVA